MENQDESKNLTDLNEKKAESPVPGGEKKSLPDEPSPPPKTSEAEKEAMGNCVSDESISTKKKNDTATNQTKIDDYYPKDRDDYTDRQGQGTKRKPGSEESTSPKSADAGSNKRSTTGASPQPMSDDDSDENAHPSRTTRSAGTFSKLSIKFDNSDDESSSGRYSWAKSDIAEYRSNYPNVRSNPRCNENYKFFMNEIRSYPDGDCIDTIHKTWFGDHRTLERHHGYIQWLFPLQEQGLNWSAKALEKHEIKLIMKEPKARNRLLTSYKMMLDFYGFKLDDEKTGKVSRVSGESYRSCFRNLNMSSHNYLRITRILKCLGEFDYEYLKYPFLVAILKESITENTLPNCLRSCKDYWIETLRSQEERRAIREFARMLVEYRNKGIRPPKSFNIPRPETTATGIEQLSLSGKSDEN